MIEISDDKLLGFKRKVEDLAFIRDNATRQFILKLRILFFKNVAGAYGDQITDNIDLDPGNKFGVSFVTLIASGNTFVDPITGLRVEPITEFQTIDDVEVEVEIGYPDGTISMFDYYSNIPKTAVAEYTQIIKGIDLMIPLIVYKEDEKGTFDKV